MPRHVRTPQSRALHSTQEVKESHLAPSFRIIFFFLSPARCHRVGVMTAVFQRRVFPASQFRVECSEITWWRLRAYLNKEDSYRRMAHTHTRKVISWINVSTGGAMFFTTQKICWNEATFEAPSWVKPAACTHTKVSVSNQDVKTESGFKSGIAFSN